MVYRSDEESIILPFKSFGSVQNKILTLKTRESDKYPMVMP